MSPCIVRLLEAKSSLGLSYESIGSELQRSEVWTAALFWGQASATIDEVYKLAELLKLEFEEISELVNCPIKGSVNEDYKFDPVIYRLYEIVHVYGVPMKEIIHEKFGDGIMSAIDFEMSIDRETKEGEQRVKVTMSGKFLPYRKW